MPTAESNYAVAFGYLDDRGTLLNSYFKRYSLRVNTTFKVKPWLRFGENVEFSYASQNSETRGATNDISALYILSPFLPKYDIAGNLAGTGKALILGDTGNPYTSRVNSLGDKSYSQSLVGSAYGEADIIKGLTSALTKSVSNFSLMNSMALHPCCRRSQFPSHQTCLPKAAIIHSTGAG